MKQFACIAAFLFVSLSGYAQKYNQENGYVANGFDVVTYFQKEPKKGNTKYAFTFDGAKFRFSSEANLNMFKENPEKYIPQYGGWCAYAIGARNTKVTIDPETYEVRNGKLYLFYNAFFNNTHSSWIEEGADELIKKGDKNWVKLKDQK